LYIFVNTFCPVSLFTAYFSNSSIFFPAMVFKDGFFGLIALPHGIKWFGSYI